MKPRFFVKTVVSALQHAAIRRRADQEGLTVAAYARAVLAQDAIPQASQSQDKQPPASVLDPTLIFNIRETLELVRLISSHTDPQAAVRITASFNQTRKENM